MVETGFTGSARRTLWLFLLIVAVSLICYYPTLQNGLLQWDDIGYILENTNIRNLSFETLSWAFTTFYVNYWAPLTWISLAIDYSIWGLNPVGYHLTNNILHALNAGLYFLLLLNLFRYHIAIRGNDTGKASILTPATEHYCAFLAALLFAVHPLRVQSVAWATERKDVLAVFFGILALVAYTRYVLLSHDRQGASRQPLDFIGSKQYWLTVAFYCLSLLSKSMLVVMPVLLLILDWFPFRRYSRQLISGVLMEKVPLAFFAGIASLLTVRSQGGSLMTFEQTNFISRFLLACKSIVLYLWMTIWPFEVSPFYVHQGRSFATIGLEQLLPVLFCFVLTVLCLATVRKWPVVMLIWLAYLVTLFPVLGFTQTGPEGMAARFTYVPGMALAFLMSLCVTALVRKFGARSSVSLISIFAVCCVVLTYSAVTRRDITHWKNDLSLWNRVIELQPLVSGRAYFERGYAYFLAGTYDKALEDTDVALRIAISKNYNRLYEIQLQRARILSQMGRFNEAVVAYTEAINADGSQARSMYLFERATLYEKMGRPDLARNDFKQAGMR
jgi:Tfp pilus assembly protein PilF